MQVKEKVITLSDCVAAHKRGARAIINDGRVVGFEKDMESLVSALKIGLELAKEKNSRHCSAGQVGTSPHKNKYDVIIPF